MSHYCHESFLNKFFTKTQTTKLICIVGFLLGLPFVMKGGFYLFELVDDYATNACFLIALLECYMLTKYIGEDTIKVLIKKKTGKELPQYIYDSLSKFAPYSLGVLFCLSFLRSVNIKYSLFFVFYFEFHLLKSNFFFHFLFKLNKF